MALFVSLNLLIPVLFRELYPFTSAPFFPMLQKCSVNTRCWMPAAGGWTRQGFTCRETTGGCSTRTRPG